MRGWWSERRVKPFFLGGLGRRTFCVRLDHATTMRRHSTAGAVCVFMRPPACSLLGANVRPSSCIERLLLRCYPAVLVEVLCCRSLRAQQKRVRRFLACCCASPNTCYFAVRGEQRERACDLSLSLSLPLSLIPFFLRRRTHCKATRASCLVTLDSIERSMPVS